MEIISREQAKERGLKRYYTGETCVNGHLDERNTKSGKCVGCLKARRDRYYNENKERIIARHKKYREENYELVRERRRQHYQENIEEMRERSRVYRENNREQCVQKSKRYYRENRYRLLEYFKQYRKDNRERCLEVEREWYYKNKEYKNQKSREWYEENRERYNERVRENYKRPEVKLARFMRGCIRKMLTEKNAPTFEMIGYTPQELRDHIEAQFEEGMSWDNHGTDWHIDHIVPIAWLIEQGETDPAVINALSNLQPMWASENLSKGAKYDPADI